MPSQAKALLWRLLGRHLRAVGLYASFEPHSRPFQRVAESCLASIDAARGVSCAADVRFDEPLSAQEDLESAQDSAAGQDLVVILPAGHTQHLVQAVLDRPGIDVRQRQGAIATYDSRLELYLLEIERLCQGGRTRPHCPPVLMRRVTGTVGARATHEVPGETYPHRRTTTQLLHLRLHRRTRALLSNCAY
jgi:hypothetical protein